MSDPASPGTTEDGLLGGTVRLLQNRQGHRAGTDAVLLAAAASPKPGDVAVDLGSGSGAVALMLARRAPETRLVLVEREPDSAALARRNLMLNGFETRARVAEVDVFASRRERLAAGLPAGQADLVLTNPPFADARDRDTRPSPAAARQAAHVMSGGGLAEWLKTAADILRPRGRLHLIHRADRLDSCLAALRPAFGSVRITPVFPRPGADGIRILIVAVKGGRGGLSMAAPLVLMAPDGRFTPEVAAMHGTSIHPPCGRHDDPAAAGTDARERP